MSTNNIVVSTNTIQTITNDATNIVAYSITVNEPIISSAQGPQGIQGVSSSTTIAELTDVNLVNLEDGSMLVYNTNDGLWRASTILEKQTLNCGQY